MAEELDESVVFPIEENEDVSERVSIQVIQNAARKWKVFFADKFQAYRKNNAEDVKLTFFESNDVLGDMPTLYSEDMGKKRTLLVGESLKVTRFNFGVLEIKPSGNIIFKVQVFGYVTGLTTDFSDTLETWQFTYDLVADLKNFETIRRANVYYSKLNSIYFECENSMLPTEYTDWSIAVDRTIKYTFPVCRDRPLYDQFTKYCILPIIRNTLLEVLRPKKEKKEESELTYHVNYGTW